MTAPSTQTPPAPTTPPVPPVPARSGAAGSALRWTGGVLGAVLVVWSGVQVADLLTQTSHTESFTYDAAPVVELVADGPVTVVAGGSQVDVVANGRAGFTATSYAATEDGDRLVVEHTCGGWWAQNCRAALDVKVPEGTRLVVRASWGEVSTAGPLGDVEVRSNDGRLAIDGVDGTVVADSGSGRVEVNGVTGRVEARTNDGEVQVTGSGGDVLATSGSGRVRVTEADGEVEARTSDGSVEVADVGGGVLARSGSGRVVVTDARGRVEARTSDGEIEVSDVRGDAVADSGSGSVTVAQVRGDVEARTSDGRVVVHGTGEAVALEISTADGRSTVDAPTDPSAARTVLIRSGSGDVSYLGPR